MAYSRWNDSRWFVFGTTPPEVPKEKQELSIHDRAGLIFRYSYLALKESLESILCEIQRGTLASEEEIAELKGYILSFLREVEEEIPNRMDPKCPFILVQEWHSRFREGYAIPQFGE